MVAEAPDIALAKVCHLSPVMLLARGHINPETTQPVSQQSTSQSLWRLGMEVSLEFCGAIIFGFRETDKNVGRVWTSIRL